jgi:hypothetical protein
MLLGAVSLVFAVPAKAGIPYAIVLTKTVGVAPGCATTDDITVDAGTVVHYCYQVKNTGYMTLNVHTLTDDVLGTLVGPNQLQDLAPGQIRTEVFSSSVNATVTNTATWTAMSSTVYYGTSQAVMTATSMDAATVNVLEMGDGACSDGIDNDGDTIVDCADPDCADAAVCRAQAPAIGTTGLLVAAVLLLVIGNLALVSRRRRV